MTATIDFMSVSRDLEVHHAVFYQLWEMGTPIFTKAIPTAAVAFDQTGQRVSFMFNPEFYEKLTPYERKFVICHECLHVILNHGYRAKGTESGEKEIVNAALDIVVNHALVERFGFERDKLSNADDLCWVDTVFDLSKEKIDHGQTYEYYYRKLRKMCKTVKIPNLKLVDDHSGLEGDWEGAIDQLNQDLSDKEKESLKDMIRKHFQHDKESKESKERGSEAGGQWTFAKKQQTVHKKKWETVIKKWALKHVQDFTSREQWARLHRRFSLLPTKLMLPSEMEEEDVTEPKKVLVWFFQDTSGSCSGLKDRFFKAAASLPPWRFDVKMHCFDTQVYETTLTSRKLYGFGGTSFQPLENYIQRYCRENNCAYPDTVFVVTDGYGDQVRPEKPERWYVFLTSHYRHCFPSNVNFYSLKDFE